MADEPDDQAEVPAHEELVAQALEAMPEDPLDNRWAAFSDDELGALDGILGACDSENSWYDEAVALRAQVTTELERRRGER